ncbi:MAG: SLBB domain-containing protein [Pyrinomonadaceae bacterium]|nr:SLBB domain-containing protein [Pyrinomonadaceae bacterium]
MQAKIFSAVFCAVVCLNGFWTADIFGQEKSNPQPTETKPTETQPERTLPNPGDDIADNQAAPKRRNEKYRIGYQDTLEVRVFRHDDLSQVVNVSPDGTILMPRIDRPISVVCKTERELAETIGTLYKFYLRNPFVSVRAVEQRSQPFAVIGAVEKPGSFYLNRRIRLLELLAFAGGPKVEKAGAKIQVARVGNVSGCAEKDGSASEDDEVVFLAYKVSDVVTGKDNPWMQPGDIVSILEAEEAYVVGNVIKPAKISLKEPVTLTQAIAIGGGLAPEAKTSKVTIQRQDANSALKTETVYDLKDIRDQKIADPVLQANDIVNVPKDSLKSARNGLIKIFTGGLPTLIRGY